MTGASLSLYPMAAYNLSSSAFCSSSVNPSTVNGEKEKIEIKIQAGLAISIWTGAWHIARHINVRRAIKKRRKFRLLAIQIRITKLRKKLFGKNNFNLTLAFKRN